MRLGNEDPLTHTQGFTRWGELSNIAIVPTTNCCPLLLHLMLHILSQALYSVMSQVLFYNGERSLKEQCIGRELVPCKYMGLSSHSQGSHEPNTILASLQ